MRPKPAVERIALIDECERGDAVAAALASAGFEVAFARDGDVADDIDFVVRLTARRSRSGILDRDGSSVPAAETASLHPSQKMELVAQLAGGVAHEFNNVLAVISICADEVLDGIGADDPRRACLVDIRDAVARGAAMTRDLLAFSRRDVHQLRTVRFAEVMTEAERMVDNILGRDVLVQVDLDSPDVCVRVDPAEWSSVFVNLALNARHAMPTGGTFAVRARTITLDPATRARPQPQGTYLELDVTDTGTGIPDGVQPRIFEPFFTTKGRDKSHGLGLSVVHGVVERSGGWIEVSSEVDVGTTFRIFLPTVEPEPPSVVEPVAQSTRPRTILLVEDEEAVRRSARRTLERNGYTVVHAGSAEEALALARTVPRIDLLVTDIVLPRMDGRRLAEILLEHHPRVAVLYTSGFTGDAILQSGADEANKAFLPKPYSAKGLLQQVEALLARAAVRR